MKINYKRIAEGAYPVAALWTIAFMLSAWLVPIFSAGGEVSAAQITTRKLTMSSGSPASSNATTIYTLNFTVPTTGTIIKSFSADVCTNAVGTCTTPTGFSVSSATLVTQPTNLGDASGWTISTATAGSLRITKSGDAATPTSSQTVVFNTVQNPTTGNTSFYLRMTTFSDAAWTTPIDTGTVAGAVVTALQVTASVAEILQFCIGATTVDDLTTAIGASCSGAPGASSTVGLGALDPTVTRISPVAASPNGGTNTNGLAVLRTNAQNGTNVYYDPIAAGSGTNHLGSLRIAGAACAAGASATDGCINSQGGTQGTFTAGTENFGFTIAGVSCVTEQTYSGAYTCSYTGGTEHLVPQTNYVGAAGSYGTTNGFAFNETTGSSYLIATAASSNSVSDEALLMKFASTPSISTPFGSYSVSIDYTVVSSY